MRITRSMTKAFVVLGLLALCSIRASAQEPPGRPERPLRPAIRVTGEATVTAKPDQAQIDIGVVTQAQTAQAASAQNAQQLTSVLGELRKVLGPGADLKTISYSISPKHFLRVPLYSIETTSYSTLPFGVAKWKDSPFFLPMRAVPKGERLDILPSAVLASSEPTIL